MRDRPLLLGSLVVITAACGFGLLGVLSRFAYEAGLEPIPFVAWRAAFGLLVILAIVAVRVRRGSRFVDPRQLGRRDAIGLVVASVAALGLNAGMFLGFSVTTIALVLLAFYTYPALVAVVAVVLGHERLDATRWMALGLALIGMVVIVGGGDAASGGSAGAAGVNLLGLGLGFAAAAWQTVYVTVSRDHFRSVPSEQVMAWVLLGTAVACAFVSVIGGGDLSVPLTSGRALFLVALTGVVAAGIPSILFLVGIRMIGGTRAGILMLLEPLVGVSLAALVLGERLTLVQVGGAAAILGAALLLQRGASDPEPAQPTMEPTGIPAGERT